MKTRDEFNALVSECFRTSGLRPEHYDLTIEDAMPLMYDAYVGRCEYNPESPYSFVNLMNEVFNDQELLKWYIDTMMVSMISLRGMVEKVHGETRRYHYHKTMKAVHADLISQSSIRDALDGIPELLSPIMVLKDTIFEGKDARTTRVGGLVNALTYFFMSIENHRDNLKPWLKQMVDKPELFASLVRRHIYPVDGRGEKALINDITVQLSEMN